MCSGAYDTDGQSGRAPSSKQYRSTCVLSVRVSLRWNRDSCTWFLSCLRSKLRTSASLTSSPTPRSVSGSVSFAALTCAFHASLPSSAGAFIASFSAAFSPTIPAITFSSSRNSSGSTASSRSGNILGRRAMAPLRAASDHLSSRAS